MSGTSTPVTVAMAGAGGEGYFKPPFTAVQWQELEHQALIYKYLVAGLPVPPDLVVPIRRSFEALSARLLHHPTWGDEWDLDIGDDGNGGGGGEGYFEPPFTAVQWQELEHQALICKYLVAGLPVSLDLVVPIRRSFEALFARFIHHPTLGYCSYYGKKFDPEPGRCRRTDGKKWRCSKDAYPDSKYCERHMHRGRNRSRKPVESQSASQSLSTAMSHITTGCSSGSGSFQSTGSETFQNLPLYSIVNPDNLYFGSNTSKLQMVPGTYGISNKECRYLHGPDADEHNFSPEVSGSMRGFEMESNIDSTWRLLSSQVPSSQLLKPINDSHFRGNSPPLQMGQAFEPMIDATMSKRQQQQHCVSSGELGSIRSVKQEQPSMRSFRNLTRMRPPTLNYLSQLFPKWYCT